MFSSLANGRASVLTCLTLWKHCSGGGQALFDIMQKLKGHAHGFGVASQGGGRVGVAMIIRAAAEEQAVFCGKLLQEAAYFF